MNMFNVPSHPLNRLFIALRVPVILGSLFVTLYFMFMVALYPAFGFDFAWGSAKVDLEVITIKPETPAAFSLQISDRIIAVNGQPAANLAQWQLLYPLFQETYDLTIQRGERILNVTLPTIQPDFDTLGRRLLLGVIAAAMWLLGTLMLLFATPRNVLAWRVAFIVMGAGVGFAAVNANAYRVPGAATAEAILVPVMAVGFAQLALIPRDTLPSRLERGLFAASYAGAILLATSNLIDLYVLRPVGLRLHLLTGLMPDRLTYLYAALFLLANPAITFWRYTRLPRSYIKQQLRIMTVGALIALTPLVLLFILPASLAGSSNLFIPYTIPFLLLLILPATYGFIIYRHKYLELDLFVTQTMALLMLALIALVFYSLFYAMVHSSQRFWSLEPLPSSLFVLVVVILMPYSSKSSQRLTRLVLYGPSLHYQRILGWATATLSSSPEVGVLRQVVQEVAEVLQVRQVALFLNLKNGDYMPIEALRAEVQVIRASEARLIVPLDMVIRTGLEPDEVEQHALLVAYPWIEVIALIRVADRVIGLLLLGVRIPDGAFDAYQIGFIRETCSAIGVTAQTIRLFEGAMQMSREQMQVRDIERTQLASEIHDEPLHRLSVVLNDLSRIAREPMLTAEGAKTLNESSLLLKEVSTQLRQICMGLQPPVLKGGDVKMMSKVDPCVKTPKVLFLKCISPLCEMVLTGS